MKREFLICKRADGIFVKTNREEESDDLQFFEIEKNKARIFITFEATKHIKTKQLDEIMNFAAQNKKGKRK